MESLEHQKLEIKLSSCEASQNHIIEIKRENEKESHNLNIMVNSLKVSLDKNIYSVIFKSAKNILCSP